MEMTKLTVNDCNLILTHISASTLSGKKVSAKSQCQLIPLTQKEAHKPPLDDLSSEPK